MPNPSKPLTAAELAQRFGGQLVGDGNFQLQRFCPPAQAGPADAAFVVHERLASLLADCRAGLVVLPPSLREQAARFQAAIVVPDPYLFFAQASQCLVQMTRQAQVTSSQIHPTAVIAPTAKLGQRIRIGAGVVVEDRVVVGDDTDIGAQSMVGEGSEIGAGGLLHPRVTIGPGVQIGQRVVLQSGAVIGSDGFGYAPDAEKRWVKIPQLGGVVLGDDVEVGANTVIDRGTLTPTRLGHGVKLDNLVQVAHNVEIGDHTAIAGCVGIAGSAKIGRYCQIGGAAGILGHLQIADGTIIGPMSLVMSSIETADKYVGIMPLAPAAQWERSAALIRRLPEMRKTLSRLARQQEGAGASHDEPTAPAFKLET